jgi:hypothetical protein
MFFGLRVGARTFQATLSSFTTGHIVRSRPFSVIDSIVILLDVPLTVTERDAIMMREPASVMKPESTNQLKNVFEQSLAVLCEDENVAAKDAHSLPIRHRSIHPQADVRKRALNDAANALASLWKISGPGRGKVSRGETCSSRDAA